MSSSTSSSDTGVMRRSRPAQARVLQQRVQQLIHARGEPADGVQLFHGHIVKRGGVLLDAGGVAGDPPQRLLQGVRCGAGERLQFVIAARELERRPRSAPPRAAPRRRTRPGTFPRRCRAPRPDHGRHCPRTVSCHTEEEPRGVSRCPRLPVTTGRSGSAAHRTVRDTSPRNQASTSPAGAQRHEQHAGAVTGQMGQLAQFLAQAVRRPRPADRPPRAAAPARPAALTGPVPDQSVPGGAEARIDAIGADQVAQPGVGDDVLAEPFWPDGIGSVDHLLQDSPGLGLARRALAILDGV